MKRLFALLLIASCLPAATLHDRDFTDEANKMQHRTIADFDLIPGTSEGQMLYWDVDTWQFSDVSKLFWDEDSSVLMVNELSLTTKLDISDYTNLTATSPIDLTGDNLSFVASAIPSDPTTTGLEGQMAWDENYYYICVSTNTWRRVAISDWTPAARLLLETGDKLLLESGDNALQE